MFAVLILQFFPPKRVDYFSLTADAASQEIADTIQITILANASPTSRTGEASLLSSRYPSPPVTPILPSPHPLRRPGLPASLLRADSRPHLRRNRAAVAVSEGAPAAPLLLCRVAARTQTARSRRLSPESNTPPHQSDASRVSRAGRTGSSDPSSAEARGSNLLRSSFACAAASVVPGRSLVAGRSPRSIMEWRDSFLDLAVTSLSLLLPMAYSSFMYL